MLSLLVLSFELAGCGEGSGSLADTLEPGASPGDTEPEPGAENVFAPGSEPRAFPLPVDALGRVAADTNPLGLNGAWGVRTGVDSSMQVRFDNGDVCFSGQAALIPPMRSNADYFGAAATLDFCRGDAADGTSAYALGACPGNAGLAQSVVGVGFSVAGMLPAVLRAGFREAARMDTPYVVVREVGEVVALFDDALVRNNPAAEFSHPEQVQSLEFLVPGNRQAARPFDFCVKNLAALTGTGWVSKEIPEWALEPGFGKRVDLVGVNLAGAEFGQQNLPGTYETDYVYPSAADIDLYVERGMNLVRLPFRWERLQRALGAELDATELQRLTDTVSYATGLGLQLVLDPHNFARYTANGVEGIVGIDVPNESFADFWRRLATIFANNPRVIFGLVNEPHSMATETWLDAANAAIAAIRETGAQNLIFVPGNSWTGAHNWLQSYYGTPNGSVMSGVVDPGNNFAFELHQYLDADSSGTGATCASTTIGVERMQDVTGWLRQGGYRAILAEFGAPANRTCLSAMEQLLNFVEENTDVWMGWAAWAGGPRWGDNLLSVQPLANGKDRPQMVVIRRHLGDGVALPVAPAP